MTVSRRVQVVAGLTGSMLIGSSYFLPWFEIRNQSATGWDLVRANAKVLETVQRLDNRLEQRTERLTKLSDAAKQVADPGPVRERLRSVSQNRPRLPRRENRQVKAPTKDAATKMKERLEDRAQSRSERAETVQLLRQILEYARLVLCAFLLTGLCQILLVVLCRHSVISGALGVSAGLFGVLFAGALVVVAFYLNGLSLPDASLSLGTGYWLAVAGPVAHVCSGLASVTRTTWWKSLPLQVFPGMFCTAFLARSLLTK